MYRETVKVTGTCILENDKHVKDFLKKSNTMNSSMDIKSQFCEDVSELLFILYSGIYLSLTLLEIILYLI